MKPEEISKIRRAHHGGKIPDIDELEDFSYDEVIDFSSNVNPYQLPDGFEEVYVEAFRNIGGYPDESYGELRESLANFIGVSPEMVVPTNGGSEALRLASDAVIEENDTVVVPKPTFSEYEREARLRGAEVERTKYENLADVEGDVAFVCNPNNPTGELLTENEVRNISEAFGYLVVDEAFMDFVEFGSEEGESLIGDLPENAVVVRSLTKSFAVTGLRLGFAVARGGLFSAFENLRPAWNVNTPAAKVGKEVVKHKKYLRNCVEKIEKERDRMVERFRGIEGVEVTSKPHANFILLKVEDGQEVVKDLLGEGVLVRDASTFDSLSNHVRVAVRKPEENDVLIEKLDLVLSED